MNRMLIVSIVAALAVPAAALPNLDELKTIARSGDALPAVPEPAAAAPAGQDAWADLLRKAPTDKDDLLAIVIGDKKLPAEVHDLVSAQGGRELYIRTLRTTNGGFPKFRTLFITDRDATHLLSASQSTEFGDYSEQSINYSDRADDEPAPARSLTEIQAMIVATPAFTLARIKTASPLSQSELESLDQAAAKHEFVLRSERPVADAGILSQLAAERSFWIAHAGEAAVGVDPIVALWGGK